ncbi:hypothetical protein [Streptomyces coelicoflavus]|uniref:hypothetical protein n=1 Tax=Streptomyces coelicoflavus TaxID=285562 RepID=UPI0036373A5C
MRATPAQAYSPDPRVTFKYVDTDNCPCSVGDPYDGTCFRHEYASVSNVYPVGPVVSAPGTSAAVEYTTHDYNLDEGAAVHVSVYDDAGKDDLITSTGAVIP